MTEAAGSSETAGGRVRKFNPGTLQSDAEIVEQFAVRRAELDIVLDVLRGNLGGPSCQHALIVAPRGRGKTMLLARAAAELRMNEELSACLLPVRFMEESHEVVNLADFWLEALFHLARECVSERTDVAAELRATHESLCGRWREQGLGELARAAVLDAADRLGRRLVLMVENLQALTANTDPDFGWQLRAVLQSETRIMLLASATSRFEGLDDAEEPFFELFRMIELKPLGTDQCRRLWEAAGGDPRSGRDIRPLEILTGGNPRLLVIVAGFSRHRSFRQLMEELVTLVDEHTEYFRGHLEVLAKLERRVYVAVIDLWRPSTTGEIAARARMDLRSVSTMLGRLVDRGAVTWRAGEDRRKRLYAAAEPLYSIYYKLRRERDEAAVVENLILFMMAFYDRFVLDEALDGLRAEAMESAPLHRGIERAFARRPTDADVRSRMGWDSLELVSEIVTNKRYADAMIRLQDETKVAFERGQWGRVIELVDRYVAEGWSRLGTAMADHEEAYLGHLRAEAHFRLGEYSRVVAIGEDLLRRFRDSRDVFIQYRSAIVLLRQTEAHARLGDFEGSVASARALLAWFGNRDDPGFGPLVADALVRQAEAESELGRPEAADVLLDEVVDRFGESDAALFGRPVAAATVRKADWALRNGLEGTRVAALYDQAIERGHVAGVDTVGRSMAVAFLNRAFVKGGLGDFEGEIASYGEFVDLFGDNESFSSEVCLALGYRSLRQAEIGDVEDALVGCAEVEARLGDLPESWAQWIRSLVAGARAIGHLVGGEPAAAVAAFRRAVGEVPERNEVSMRTLTRLTLDLVALGASERDLAAVLAGDKGKAAAAAPLIAALRERCGERVRVPEEVRSVAADIRREMGERTDKGRLTAF